MFLVAVVGSFFAVKHYFDFLTRPARLAWMAALSGQEPVFRFASPTEPFWVYTKLALYGSLRGQAITDGRTRSRQTQEQVTTAIETATAEARPSTRLSARVASSRAGLFAGQFCQQGF